MDPTFAAAIGINIDDLLISQPDTGEQALEICEALVRSNAVDVIVIDSVAALVPRAEIEGDMGDSLPGLQARLMSQALRKLTGAISRSRTAVIFINQLREKIGIVFGNPETTPGGRALKFYSSVRIELRRVESLKQSGTIIGNRVRGQDREEQDRAALPRGRVRHHLLAARASASAARATSSTWARSTRSSRSRAPSTPTATRRWARAAKHAKEFLRAHPEIALEIEELIRARARRRRREPAQPIAVYAGADEERRSSRRIARSDAHHCDRAPAAQQAATRSASTTCCVLPLSPRDTRPPSKLRVGLGAVARAASTALRTEQEARHSRWPRRCGCSRTGRAARKRCGDALRNGGRRQPDCVDETMARLRELRLLDDARRSPRSYVEQPRPDEPAQPPSAARGAAHRRASRATTAERAGRERRRGGCRVPGGWQARASAERAALPGLPAAARRLPAAAWLRLRDRRATCQARCGTDAAEETVGEP